MKTLEELGFSKGEWAYDSQWADLARASEHVFTEGEQK